MASWRDQVSEHAQAELDGLLGVVLPLAKEMLADVGEFYPWGAALSLDETVRLIAGDPGTGDHPDPTEVLALIHAQMAEAAHELAATAVVTDVVLRTPPTRAIRVELEHRDGVAIAVLVAYDLVGHEPAAGVADTVAAAGEMGSEVVVSSVTGIEGERRTWSAG